MKILINASPVGEVRREEKDGTEYLVAPVTFIKSMNLHRGYVPKREVEKATDKWPGTPIVADHPQDADGEYVSVNSDAADKTPFGFIDNTETEVGENAETKGEIWINVKKAESIGGEPEKIKDDLASNRTLSVSSAYGGVRLPAGEYDGEHRDRVVGNLRPDHLAILRNREGRCSVQDGCMAGPNAVSANSNVGLMFNAVEFEDDESAVNDADDSISPENGQDEAMADMDGAYNALSEARTPEYDGTTEADWSSPTFSEYVSAYDYDAEQVSDLSADERQEIAEHTLLGESDAETFTELQVFPVVEPGSRNLSENALVAVLGGRGAQADIPESALESARNVARTLLEDEFDRDMSANSGFWSKLAESLGFAGVLSGNQEAEEIEDVNANATGRDVTIDVLRDFIVDVTNAVEDDADVNWRNLYRIVAAIVPGAEIDAVEGMMETEISNGIDANTAGNVLDELKKSDSPMSNNMSDRTKELVELGFNAENLPDEDTQCFDRIYDEFASNDESEGSPEEPEEQVTEETNEDTDPAVSFDTEEEFEETVGEIVEKRVEEAFATNEKRQEKAKLADDIIANSDDHDEDDRDSLMESPKSVLETLANEVTQADPTPDYRASRGVSANSNDSDDSGMPALSVSERTKGDE